MESVESLIYTALLLLCREAISEIQTHDPQVAREQPYCHSKATLNTKINNDKLELTK